MPDSLPPHRDVERRAELEGRVVSYTKREWADGTAPHYSFDRGATWRSTLAEAWEAMKAGGGAPAEPEEEAGPFETFLVQLVAELHRLKPGESLKLVRTSDAVLVQRETTVMACRGSDVPDVLDPGLFKEES